MLTGSKGAGVVPFGCGEDDCMGGEGSGRRKRGVVRRTRRGRKGKKCADGMLAKGGWKANGCGKAGAGVLTGEGAGSKSSKIG